MLFEKTVYIYEDAEKNYPLPSAFATYTKCLNIMQGSGKIKGEFSVGATKGQE